MLTDYTHKEIPEEYAGVERRLSGRRYEAARKGWGPAHSPNTAVWVTRPLSWHHTWSW